MILAGSFHSRAFDEIGDAARGLYTPRRGLFLALLAAASFCLVINSSWRATPDSALYLELGESLARGHGFIFNSEPHTYVPPGYPALVAASARIMGESFLTYRILMALMGLLAAGAGFLLLRRMCGPDTGFLAGGLFALNHALLFNSTFTSSDVPFAFCTLVALNALLSAAGRRRRVLWLVAAALLAGLPPLVRVNGWGVPLSSAIFLLCYDTKQPLMRRVPRVASFMAIAVIPGIIWALHKASYPVSLQEGTWLAAISGRTFHTQTSIMLKAAWEYVSETSYALTAASIKTDVLEFIVPGLVLAGLVAAARRGERFFVPLTVIQYCGLLLSPAGSRYLIMLLPGMYLFLALGLIRFSQWVAPRLERLSQNPRLCPSHGTTKAYPGFSHPRPNPLPEGEGGIHSGLSRPLSLGERDRVRGICGTMRTHFGLRRQSLAVHTAALLRPDRLVIYCFALLAILNVGANAITIFQARNALQPGGAEAQRDLLFFTAAHWLRQHATDGVVMSMHPRVIHYLSGLPSVELIRSGVPEHQVWVRDPEVIRRLMLEKNPGFFFSDANDPQLFEAVSKALDSLDLGLEEIAEARSSPRFALWRIRQKE